LIPWLVNKKVVTRAARSAAEAGTENKCVIAAVNRCATQKQEQNRVFQ